MARRNRELCPSCYHMEVLEPEPDRSGRRVCFGCFIPVRMPTGATEDFLVAPPNAKNVTPGRMISASLARRILSSAMVNGDYVTDEMLDACERAITMNIPQLVSADA